MGRGVGRAGLMVGRGSTAEGVRRGRGQKEKGLAVEEVRMGRGVKVGWGQWWRGPEGKVPNGASPL